MRLAGFLTALSTIGLVTILASAALAAIPGEPGYHTAVPLPEHSADVNDTGRGSNSYELYLPKAYGKSPEVRHPLVFVLGAGAGGNRRWINEWHLADWAEKQSPPAIIVGVNRVFNAGVGIGFGSVPGEPKTPGEEGMADYWKLADQIPQAHPTLRFLLSWAHGGTGDSRRVTSLAVNHPDKVAGYLVGPHPYRLQALENQAFPLKKDISVAVLHVTREAYARGRPATPYTLNESDNFDPQLWERAYLGHLRHSGNPWALIESVDWRLRETSIHEALSYLVESSWQVKGGVTATERAAAKQALLQVSIRAASIEDVIELERRYRTLWAVPGASEWPEAKELLETWRKLVSEAADRRTEPLFRAFFLETMREHPLIKADSATADRVAQQWAELQATEAYKKEVAAQKALRAAVATLTFPQSSSQDIVGLEATIGAFQAALEISDGTLAGKEGKAWLAFLTKRHAEQLKKREQNR
jgi:hypothetical protein